MGNDFHKNFFGKNLCENLCSMQGPLLGKFGRRLVEFSSLSPKLCCRLAGVLFYGPCFTWRASNLEQVILLVWPK